MGSNDTLGKSLDCVMLRRHQNCKERILREDDGYCFSSSKCRHFCWMLELWHIFNFIHRHRLYISTDTMVGSSQDLIRRRGVLLAAPRWLGTGRRTFLLVMRHAGQCFRL
jgi:hypothetical protein